MTKAAYPRLHLPIIISCLLANLGAIIGFQEFSISNLMAFFPGSERWHVTIGIGLFVAKGASAKLRQLERARFMRETWPPVREQMALLDIGLPDLLERERA